MRAALAAAVIGVGLVAQVSACADDGEDSPDSDKAQGSACSTGAAYVDAAQLPIEQPDAQLPACVPRCGTTAADGGACAVEPADAGRD